MASFQSIDNFPEKSVILIEEDLGLAKSVYSSFIAYEAASAGKEICYITTRSSEDVRNDMKRMKILPIKGFYIEEMQATSLEALLNLLSLPSKCNLVIVDQFPLYFLEASIIEFRDAILRISAIAKTGRVFLLLVDLNIIPKQYESLLRSMADGVIQVTNVNEGDKIKRYLNIPKMQGASLIDKMLPFTVNEDGFLIDTRERHG